MGTWKATCTLRIAPESKAALEEFAKRERRSIGNLGAVLLEWSIAELSRAGSTERLLHRKVPIPRNPDGNYRKKVVANPGTERDSKTPI